MGRIVLPLGVCLALGSIAAGQLIPYLTAGKIDLKSYQGFFGLTVLVIGAFLLYETTPQGQRRKKDAKAAAEAFEREHIRKAAASANPAEPEIAGGVHLKEFGIGRISFTFYGVEFGFNPILALVGGFVINCISSSSLAWAAVFFMYRFSPRSWDCRCTLLPARQPWLFWWE